MLQSAAATLFRSTGGVYTDPCCHVLICVGVVECVVPESEKNSLDRACCVPF